MKVLILSHTSELLGGAEMSMLDVVSEWVKNHKVEPEFIIRKPVLSLGTELNRRGWKYHALDYTFWSDSKPPIKPDDIYYQALHNSDTVLEIEDIIKKSKPDFVLTNSVVSPWAAVAAYYTNTPHVWFVREFGDLDHGRKYLIGREKTYQDVDSMSDLVAGCSQTLAEYLKKYINPEKVTAIYTPFSKDEVLKQSKANVESPYKYEDSLKLVLTGNLATSKGQLEVVKAVGECNKKGANVELCLVGRANDTEYADLIKKQAKLDGNADKIHLVGFQDNPLALVSKADVGLMMSTMEAFGRVTFEYLLLNKPVIGRNSGATPEMVHNRENGLLFNNESEIAEKILQYYNNKEMLEKHAKNSGIVADKILNSEFSAEATYTRIEKVVKKKKANPILNISHEWLQHTRYAEDNIDYTHTMSFSKIIYFRGRRKLKHLYKKVFK